MSKRAGVLIVFEGIDGAGKTTQVNLLSEALGRAGEEVVVSKEPTAGVWGQKVRDSARTGRLPPEEELDAFVNDRIEHLESLVKPALDGGKVVILDRYYHSTVAYQGARGMDVEALIARMGSIAIKPDAAFILDLDVETALVRVNGRDTSPNKFERKTTLTKCRRIYKVLAQREPFAIEVDAYVSINEMHRDIVNFLIDGALRQKRCAQVCEDEFYCSYRMTDSCDWHKLKAALLPQTNFSKILEELRAWGVNDYTLAERTGIERSKLSKLRTGDRKQPNYDDGVLIMDVYRAEKRRHPQK